jgi:hypothetical protein
MGLVTRIVLTIFVEPWIGKKLEDTLSENNPNYKIQISKVNVSLVSPGIELKNILISSESEDRDYINIKGKIASVRLKGIRVIKAVFHKSIVIRRVTISVSEINVITPSVAKDGPPIIIPFNIKIGRLLLDKTHLLIKNKLNSLSYSLNEGMIKVSNINFYIHDTLSIEKLQNFELAADDVSYVSADSMYTYNLKDIEYSSVSQYLSADTFSILPNYSDYDFTSRFEFQKDRINPH